LTRKKSSKKAADAKKSAAPSRDSASEKEKKGKCVLL
jgi:hypothetical protein